MCEKKSLFEDKGYMCVFKKCFYVFFLVFVKVFLGSWGIYLSIYFFLRIMMFWIYFRYELKGK